MSITFKLLIATIIGFIIFNSVLTGIFATLGWLINKFEWKAWVGIGLVVLITGAMLYSQFEPMMVKVLELIQ